MTRIDRLTSVRGIAALYVVLFHCQALVAGFDLTPWTNLLEKGYLAVDFFFVLSGFILAYVYASPFDEGRAVYKRFLWLRLARIYPVHLVTLVVALGIWGFGDRLLVSNTPRTLAGNVLLVQAWGLTRKLSFNFPAWSVSAEWFVYLAFPWLLALSSPFARRPALAVAGAIASIAVLAACSWLLLAPGIVIGGTTLALDASPARPFDMASTFALVRVTLEFLSGLLLFRGFDALRSSGLRRVNRLTTVLAAILLLTLHSSRLPPLMQDTLAVSMVALLIPCLALGGGAGWLDSRLARLLGDASYSIYMVHGLVALVYVDLVDRHIIGAEPSLATGTLIATMGVAIVIALGIVMHRVVEAPARDTLRAWRVPAPARGTNVP